MNSATQVWDDAFTILRQAHPQHSRYYKQGTQEHGESYVTGDGSGRLLAEERANVSFSNETVELLKSLYQTLDSESGQELRKALIQATSPESSDRRMMAHAILAIAKIYGIGDALSVLLASSSTDDDTVRALHAISDFIFFEHEQLNEAELLEAANHLVQYVIRRGWGQGDLSYVSSASKAVAGYAGRIKLQAERLKFVGVRDRLTLATNYEINQDRERLAQNLKRLGFSERLSNFLDFAEVEFRKADNDFSYRTCVDQVRTFFAELLGEVASKVASHNGDDLRALKVEAKFPVSIRDYLKKRGFLSEQLHLLITGLYRFMSDEGTHAMGADRGTARIARNISIEVGLLITKRVDNFKQGSANA
jgi:hypothetical protein